jgi:internalin A
MYAPGASSLGRSIGNPARLSHDAIAFGLGVGKNGRVHRLVSEIVAAPNHPETLLIEPPLRYVTPFRPDAVAQFAKHWFFLREPEPANAEKRANEFLAALSSRGDLSEMGRTPQLLGMMCLVHYYQSRLPDGRAELYSSVVRAYLIDIPRIIGRDIIIDPDDRVRWLSAIGFHMQRQRTVAEEEHDTVGVTVPEPTLRSWLQAIHVAEHHLDLFIHFLGRRAGLLLPRGKDEAGNEVYAFLHLSFQEYFAARYLAERDPSQPRSSALASLGVAEPSSGGEIDKEQFLAWSRDPVWQETFRLLFQVHAPSQADNLAGELFSEFSTLVGGAIHDKKHASEVVGHLGFLLSDVVLGGKSRISEAVRRGLRTRLIELEFQSQTASERLDKEWGKRHSIGMILQLIEFSVMTESVSLSKSQVNAATVLDLRNSSVSDLEPIKELKQLRTLDLGNTPVSNLSPIKELKQLVTLVLYGTLVRNLEPIKELKQLKKLYLGGTQVSDLNPIQELKQLTTLDIGVTPVSDLQPIKGLKQLTTLNLWGTQVSGLQPIKQLKQLTTLDLSYTRVSDLTPIKELKHLTTLGLSGTQVRDLSPIKELKQLTTLYLVNTQASDLSPINELGQLTTLHLINTQVSAAQKEELKKHLPNLKIID